MDDPYQMTRKESVAGAGVFILIGVILALFEGWVLGTAANEGVDAVFGRRRAWFVVPAALLLAAALLGLAIAAYRSGRYMFRGKGSPPSAVAGAAVAVVYILVVACVLGSKYYRLWWTESLGVMLLIGLALYVVLAMLFAVGRGLITGDWSHFK